MELLFFFFKEKQPNIKKRTFSTINFWKTKFLFLSNVNPLSMISVALHSTMSTRGLQS